MVLDVASVPLHCQRASIDDSLLVFDEPNAIAMQLRGQRARWRLNHSAGVADTILRWGNQHSD
jgi:hypothetical protein